MLARCVRARLVLLILSLGAALPVSVAASEDAATRTTFDYGLSVGALQLRDDLLRPLRWTGAAASVELGLAVETANWLHRAELELGAGLLWNRFGHEGMVVTQGAHYALMRELNPGGKVRIFAGLAYRYESLDAYYFDWDDSFLYWFTTHSLAPAVAFEPRSWRGFQLLVAIELPLVALQSRPPVTRIYKVDPLPYPERWPGLSNRGLTLVGPNELFAPTLSVHVDRALGRHVGVRSGLELAYRRAIAPRGYYALAERLLLELRYAF